MCRQLAFVVGRGSDSYTTVYDLVIWESECVLCVCVPGARPVGVLSIVLLITLSERRVLRSSGSFSVQLDPFGKASAGASHKAFPVSFPFGSDPLFNLLGVARGNLDNVAQAVFVTESVLV